MDTNLPIDLNLPSEQEMLDKVYEHYITNNQLPSYYIGDTWAIHCRYRGPNGTKCAFGLFIPDELYHSGMEGLGPGSIVKMHEPKFARFCSYLQSCHDNAARTVHRGQILPNTSNFKKDLLDNLAALARKFNLVLPH